MKTFTINGKTYVARNFDFNLICDLEDMGIKVEEMGQKPNSVIRAYFTLCSGVDKAYAGAEMEAHVMNGGDFTEVSEVIYDKMQESDFFRTLNQREEQETQTEKKTTTTKKTTTKKTE